MDEPQIDFSGLNKVLNPAGKKQWLEKVEKALGTSYWDARDTLSQDQIIGIFRELEYGKDPHKSKRKSRLDELAESVTVFHTSPPDIYRDTIDERLWIAYMSGILQNPKNKRQLRKFTPEMYAEYLEMYLKMKNEKKG
jgi:hypothetical protein